MREEASESYGVGWLFVQKYRKRKIKRTKGPNSKYNSGKHIQSARQSNASSKISRIVMYRQESFSKYPPSEVAQTIVSINVGNNTVAFFSAHYMNMDMVIVPAYYLVSRTCA